LEWLKKADVLPKLHAFRQICDLVTPYRVTLCSY